PRAARGARPAAGRGPRARRAPAAARRDGMSLGVSLFLIAVGAILHWAVTATLAGIDIQTVGTILMIVGVIGFLISLWFLIASGRQSPPRQPPGPPPPPGY